jgi:hypothetical protein
MSDRTRPLGLLAGIVAAAALALATTPVATADEPLICPPDITGQTVTGNVVVLHHTECAITDSTILGSIQVEESADLHFVSSRLNGNVWVQNGTPGDSTLVDFNGGSLNGVGGILTGDIGSKPDVSPTAGPQRYLPICGSVPPSQRGRGDALGRG